MEKNSRIFVAGSQTQIGKSIFSQLRNRGYENIISQDLEPDLLNEGSVITFFKQQSPEYVFYTAGKSGGIEANTKYPADFMQDNLIKQCHVIDSAYQNGTKKLLYLASSCIYPKVTSQPMRVEALFNGALEPTNESYAMAKLAGLVLCKAYRRQYNANFIVGIPANEFGPGDDFNSDDAHVLPSLMGRMHRAKLLGQNRVEIWGSGDPRREFIHVDDLADACVFLMLNYDEYDPINIGSGYDVSIKELAYLVKDIIGYKGEIFFNKDRPDGMPLKVLDSTVLKALGWESKMSFAQALTLTYQGFIKSQQE